MALGDWVSGLFQSEQTRGLSGGSAPSVALDDKNPYYNFRLLRHRADGDLIQEPELLWYTSPFVKQRSGMGTHVASEIGDGTANYTDVLIVLSQGDHERATAEEGWFEKTMTILREAFETLCKREGLRRVYPDRPIGFRFLCDGDPEMAGQQLGLSDGEFVTGLLPNLYSGQVEDSWPVLTIYLNIPDAWEGYREVGTLYNDQRLFTLGGHWLDNYHHPKLIESALYRLQQFPDGSFVHIVNPDLQDRYQLTAEDQDGAHVLTLATREGEPLAYLVLAALETPEASQTDNQPTANDARSSVPSVAPPMIVDGDDTGSRSLAGTQTIIPDAPNERIFTLQERGVLLQKIHFSAFMLGYDVYFGKRGELGTVVEDPALTFQVRRRSVSIVPHVKGATVDGTPVEQGSEYPIQGDVTIDVAGQRLAYGDLSVHRKGVAGWPYVGVIRRPASSTYMLWGERYLIGRSRDCRVVLPDESRNDNIRWKPKVGDGSTIRARTGEIPKSKFYTDSIMVASEHASIDIRDEQPRFTCTARHCYTFVRHNDVYQPLFPAASLDEPKETSLAPGDEILIGNCLFHVGFTPAEQGTQPTVPAPRVSLSEGLSPLGSISDAPARGPVDPAPPPPPIASDDPTAPPTPPRDPLASISDVPEPQLDDIASAAPPAPPDEPSADAEEAAPPAAEEAPQALPAPPEEDVGGWDEDWDDDVATPDDAVVEAQPLGAPAPEQPDAPEAASGDAPEAAPPPAASEEAPPEDAPAEDTASAPAEKGDDAPPEQAADATPEAERTVSYVDDSEAQFELGRPMHVLLSGWMVNGDYLCGNHDGADLVIPESRMSEDQAFEPTDYFRLRVRGRKGTLTVLSASELLIDEDDAEEKDYSDPDERIIDVIRRDDLGEEDFVVRLGVENDRTLPDPRARFLGIDIDDPLAAALFTYGLPKATDRQISIGPLTMTFHYDGKAIIISDYLATYAIGDGFRAFFVQHGDGRFKTAPEDGTPIELQSGDRFLVDNTVYVVFEE